MKNFPVTERIKVQFRADLFNILNHPNFAGPDAGLCTAVTPASATTPASCTGIDSTGKTVSTLNPKFGAIGQTIADNVGSQIGTGTARQAQLSLKVIF
jgi:hypothetical protein